MCHAVLYQDLVLTGDVLWMVKGFLRWQPIATEPKSSSVVALGSSSPSEHRSWRQGYLAGREKGRALYVKAQQSSFIRVLPQSFFLPDGFSQIHIERVVHR